MISQLIQIVGSLLILGAFTLLQTHKLTADSKIYLLINLVGSVILGINAVYEHQWGFILLETIWAGVSAIALLRTTRSRRQAPNL